MLLAAGRLLKARPFDIELAIFRIICLDDRDIGGGTSDAIVRFRQWS